MSQAKYLFLVSSDATNLSKIAQAFAEECKVLEVHFTGLIFKCFLSVFTFSHREKYGKFKVNQYKKLIQNNLQRKLIRSPWLFERKLIFQFYKLIMVLKCHVLKKTLLEELRKHPYEKVLVWNGSLFPQSLLVDVANAEKVRVVFFENGHFPNTIQADTKGINYNSSVTQDKDFYLNYNFKDTDPLPEDIGIRYTKLSYSTETYHLPDKFIFVPFQVPSDMQVLNLSPWIPNMNKFYDVLYKAVHDLKDLCFVVKEHPSFRLLIQSKVPKHNRIIFANGLAAKELITKSQAVITINSTVGMEALVLKKKVITLGLAMYNVPGLVQESENYSQFIQALQNLESWKTDEHLRKNYLKFINNYFLIKGSYQDITHEMLEKIRSL